MGKKTIWIFSIGIAVVIVLIITVYIILSSYDFNKLKPQISKIAKDATGRELILGGDIELNMGIIPSLTVDRVSFQNASWGSQREMAKIKYLEVKMALLPLIFGNREIKRLIVVEPDILIETDPSGKSNLSFETAKEGEAENEVGDNAAERIRCVHGGFRLMEWLRDHSGGVSWEKNAGRSATLSSITDGCRAASCSPVWAPDRSPWSARP